MAVHRAFVHLALAIAAGTGVAHAQVSTEPSASILLFPKIVYDGSRDTVIQIVNGAHSAVHARCWYVNAAPTFPDLPPGPLNPPLWSVTEFALSLVADQPTSIVASLGRPLLDEPACTRLAGLSCYGAGRDPGEVPALPLGFTGELRCVETDAAGFPINGNHLSGDAALVDALTGDATRYGAIGIRGRDQNNGDNELRLGEEYDACPRSLVLDHAPDGSEDPQLGSGSAIENEITFTACSTNLDVQTPEQLIVSFQVRNELAQQFSAAASVPGWQTLRLTDVNSLFSAEALGGAAAETSVRVSLQTLSGVLGVAEETHRAADGRLSAAATNLHTAGTNSAVDVIVLP